MDETARELEPAIEEILQKLIEGRQKTEDLLNLKNHTDRLNSFEAHVLEVMAAIMQVLENDEDMAAMYLTNAHLGYCPSFPRPFSLCSVFIPSLSFSSRLVSSFFFSFP
jgi:hypothetical protein